LEERKNIFKAYLRRALKTLMYCFLSVFFLFLLLLGLINIPSVQTKIVQNLSSYLSEKINFPIEITRVNIAWFDHLLLYGVTVQDPGKFRMIEVDELKVDFELSTIFQNNEINLDQVELNKLAVRLIKDSTTRDLNIDSFIKSIGKLFASSDTSRKPSKAVRFTIDGADLNNCYFKYSDLAKDTIHNGFDHNHFSIDSIYSEVGRFTLIRDTIEIDVKDLRGKEDNVNLPVRQLTTFFRYTKHSMQFHKLKASIGSSELRDSLVFEYKNVNDLGEFNSKVKVTADLHEANISTKDLALFAPDLKPYNDRWILSGKAKGIVNQFSVKDFNLKFGRAGSTLKGNVRFDGLPDFFETFIELSLRSSVIYTQDLAQYVNEERTNKMLDRINTVSFHGKFLGFPDDFVANGEFFSPVGYIKSDVNLKLDSDSLKGNLITRNLDLGKITGSSREVQQISMSGHLEGKGFKLQNASYKLDAKIARLGLFSYDYKNITTDATLKNQFFEGKLNIKDSNLVMKILGKIDLRENFEELNLKAEIDTAFLKALNITPEFTIVSSDVDINTKGQDLDNIVGTAIFKNTFVRHKENEATIDSLYIDSKKDISRRTFYLWSNPLEINADGDFNFTSIYEDVPKLLHEYYLNFLNNKKLTGQYYSEKRGEVFSNYGVNYHFHFKEINPIIHLFTQDVSISDNVILKGRFSNGYTSILNFNTYIDSINYKNYKFEDIEVDISSSKKADSSSVQASAYVYSKNQRLANFLETKDFTFEGIWDEKEIEFNTFIQERNVENVINLSGIFDFLQDSTNLHFTSSLIKVLDNVWTIKDENKITFTPNSILFKNFSLNNESQAIAVEGDLATNAIVSAHNFDLLVLSPLINKSIIGKLNGFVSVKDFYNDFILDSKLTIDSLVFDEIYVGDFDIGSAWDKIKRVVSSSIELKRGNKEILSAKGDYNPYKADSALNFTAKLTQMDLVLFEPFIKDIISQIGGTASGDIKITGKVTNPMLQGEAFVKNGALTVNYLNTAYTFNDWIYLTEDGIIVKRLRIKDDAGNTGILDGGIYYDSFKNFVVYLTGDLENFKVLNTSVEENDLFYGTAIVTGNFEILGAFTNLDIKANARSNKGTKIFVPLGGYTKVEEEEYIRFVSKRDTTTKAIERTKTVDLRGIRLDFNLDVTPDAMCELIFDARSGDIIRGYGEGQIKMEIDTKGEFSMFGNYELRDGGYNFTLANIINKEFDILPGSTITWYGDPYKALLDIRAEYEQRVSYAPIISSIEDKPDGTGYNPKNDPQVRRPYPVIVQLFVKGDLLSPDIDYEIEFEDYPSQITLQGGDYPPVSLFADIQTFENNIQLDEQELNRQVFSLLILRRLQPPAGDGLKANAGGSVSELLSNQLSYWASQYDENLDVQLDLNGLDADAWNTFQLRISYSAWGGRLKVTREGGFTNQQNQTNFASIAGEWTIEYDLTPDGVFRAKLYNRNNYNTLNLNQQANTTGGLSLMHTQSFDVFNELNIFKKKKLEEEEELPRDDDLLPQSINNKGIKEEEIKTTSNESYLPHVED